MLVLGQEPVARRSRDDERSLVQANDWRARVIRDIFDIDDYLEPWIEDAYAAYLREVSDPAYPCYFGHAAERDGEIFYAFVSALDRASLIRIMSEFVRRGSRIEYRRYNLAVFFEPIDDCDTHARFFTRFWRTLQMLHDGDPLEASGDPDEPHWEFTFAGSEMFVVGANRTYKNRRSRNLGLAQVMLFQPRSVFIDKITNEAIGAGARRAIRERLSKWDDVSHHPDLGVFGAAENREWKQYCLPDENVPIGSTCPLKTRRPQRQSTAVTSSK